MKFLFVLQYPGYTRYFDSVIRLLIDRGHTVAVVYDRPEKQPEGNEALADLPVELLGKMPKRRSKWALVGAGVRGTIDYVRYLDPRFAGAPYLRDRMRKALPPAASWLGRFDTIGTGPTNFLLWILHACERAIPPSGTLERFLREIEPSAVIVSPLVTDQCPQVDVVKTAQAIGLPNALFVASWDHLTTKGLMRVRPDLVAVWNEQQRDEATAYHRIGAERIVVTGAHPFDRWFDRVPSRDRDAFCRHVGLRSDQPFVLFVGSTASISNPADETVFVREWAKKLRLELAKRSIDAGILIRPHPYNSAHWASADLSDIDNAAVFPRYAANPVNDRDRADYFDSMYHSAAVVGINTSAMIEAAIVGRTVHTILDPAFASTQEGTLHFRYLLPTNGGFLRVATSLEEHVAQVVDTLRDPSANAAELEAFVRAFVRPRGLATPATPLAADALETLAQRGTVPVVRMPVVLYPLRAVLSFAGSVAARHEPGRARLRIASTIRHWRKRARKKIIPSARRWRKSPARALGQLRNLARRVKHGIR